MLIIGLTGSIGMGKSTAARMLRHKGVWVFDSDAAVHSLTAKNGPALPHVAAAFPGSVTKGVLDRKALGAAVFKDPTALKRLEAILHPMVSAKRQAFLAQARRNRQRFVVLDVPLLFETKGDRRCDLVWVVSAPAWLQRQRVLARPGMTPGKLDDILARQMPDHEKRRRADRVFQSGLGHAFAWRAMTRAVKRLRQKSTS